VKNSEEENIISTESSFWKRHKNTDVICKPDSEQPNKDHESEEREETLEEFKAKHCECCRHHAEFITQSTQTDFEVSEIGVQVKPSLIDNETQVQKMTTSFGIQTDMDPNSEQKLLKQPVNLLFENIMSDSEMLGLPTTKRGRDLASTYNELNSIIGKMKKVVGRRKIQTPSTSYLSYRFFEQLDKDIQGDIIVNFKELIKMYRDLRRVLIDTRDTEIFNDQLVNLMRKIQTRLLLMNNNLTILCESQEGDTEIITSVEENPDEGDKTEIVIHGVAGDYNLTSTPQEGNKSNVMSFDESLISSLLS
jgi:hypothetical protein